MDFASFRIRPPGLTTARDGNFLWSRARRETLLALPSFLTHRSTLRRFIHHRRFYA
jgi:hypothetical protein